MGEHLPRTANPLVNATSDTGRPFINGFLNIMHDLQLIHKYGHDGHAGGFGTKDTLAKGYGSNAGIPGILDFLFSEATFRAYEYCDTRFCDRLR